MSIPEFRPTSDSLKRIAQRGGHAWGSSSSQDWTVTVVPEVLGKFLLWQEESYTRDHNADCGDRRKFFEMVFPIPEVLRSQFPEPRPRFSFLEFYWPGKGFPTRPMDRGSSEAKRIRAEYDAEIEAINHLIKTEGRPGLDSELRALKERLVEYSGVLEKICKSILPIFQVWIVETEREILRGRCEDDLSSKERTEVHYTRHKLYRSAADLWKNIVRGRPRENIEKGMHDKLNHEYTPDGLAEAQIYGVTPLMNHREIILKQSAPFHRRWRMCEFAQENFLRSGILGTIRTSRISMKDGKAILPPLHSSGAADAEKQPEPRGRKQTHVMKAMKATLEREGADDFEDAIKKVVETEGFKYANARRAFYRYLKALKERTGSRPSDTTELLELLRRVFPAE